MSMRTLLVDVRNLLKNNSTVTDLVPEEKITFARRPQRDSMPGITFNIGSVGYDESIPLATEAITYRVNVNIYGRTADETTEIHDAVKAVIQGAVSSTYVIRLEDERYGVDVDNNHVALVGSTWQISTGGDGAVVNYLSPSWQGHDRMDINYDFKIGKDLTTTVSLTEQVYYLDFVSSSGQGIHYVQLPSAEDNVGKIYTFILGTNVDNNTLVRLLPATGESVETAQGYDLNRAHSAVNIVAVQTSGGASPDYGWRIWAYHGLHD
jgi:hypothetical protein